MNYELALLEVRQMGEADRLAVASGIPLNELMENAGRAVAKEIERRWSPRPVVVLCGPGNNGGDGFVVARWLAKAAWPVRLALLGEGDRLTGEVRQNAGRWPGKVEPMGPAVLAGAELVVDAIFGAGLSRALTGPPLETLAEVARRGLPMVAVDVPSGLLGDTGEAMGAVMAALTVTFFRKKPGHVLLPGRKLCGELVVADIGIPPAVLEQIRPNTFENAPGLWSGQLPVMEDDGEIQKIPPLPNHAGFLIFTKDELGPRFGLSSDSLTQTRAAAHTSGEIIGLVGANTVIAKPGGRVIIQPGEFPESGSKALLLGMANWLSAQKMDPFFAAAAAFWFYGMLAEAGKCFAVEDLEKVMPEMIRRFNLLT